MKFGETRRGWLGVRIQSVDDATAEALASARARGALVAGIDEKGPAKPAGVETGDVDRQVRRQGREGFARPAAHRRRDARRQGRAGHDRSQGARKRQKTVKLGRLEDGEKVQAASANKPATEAPKPAVTSALGLELSGQTDELRKRYSIKDGLKGVLITKVDANSNAADKRILVGELIVEVGQEPVNSPQDVTKRLDALKKEGKKSALLLVFERPGRGPLRRRVDELRRPTGFRRQAARRACLVG